MQKGNVNGSVKILTNNMSGGILPLIDETLQLLELKNTKMHPIVYDHIGEELIKSSNKNKRFGAIRTKCRWVAKDYSFIMLWKSNIRSPKIAELVKKLLSQIYQTTMIVHLWKE